MFPIERGCAVLAEDQTESGRMKSYFFAIVLGLLVGPVLLSAQQDDQRANELGERQRRAETKMKELEAKFEMIAQKLEAQEPDH